MNKLIRDNLEAIRILCKEHHTRRLFVFGSATIPQFGAGSDVDFIYEPDYSGFDFDQHASNFPYDPVEVFFALKDRLEGLLGRKVDLIPDGPFKNPYFNKSVQSGKQLLFQNERQEEGSG